MIIGYLVLGFVGAVLSAAGALLSGYGILAAVGFYILGGSLSTLAIICISLCCRTLYHPKLVPIKA